MTTQTIEVGIAPHTSCQAVVIIPARNEEDNLSATLDALRLQQALDGSPMQHEHYEVHVLLNNCTDGSVAVAEAYAEAHPRFRLSVHACTLQPGEAHVGTARSMLMEMACRRLEMLDRTMARAILSTDADTLVALDWVAQNLAEIAAGADAVGGLICLAPENLAALDPGARRAYERDRVLQGLAARLESLLDPDEADPWPRHLHHFGASLACTPAIYRRSGGMPAVKPLEDVAFVDALRKAGARIRHSPNVKIVTSARLDGRAEVGLSGQLRIWSEDEASGAPQMVDSADWSEHRFRTLGMLRRFHRSNDDSALRSFPRHCHQRMLKIRGMNVSTARFLEFLDCNALIDAMYEEIEGEPARRDEITRVIKHLKATLAALPDAP